MIENPNVICNECAYCKQNKELAERLKKTQELELEVRRENIKLKEILKECRNYTQIMVNAANLRHLEWHEDTAYNDGKDILIKINQALGEDE